MTEAPNSSASRIFLFNCSGDLLAYLNESTLIVVGWSHKSRFGHVFNDSILNRLMRQSGRINVLVVGNEKLSDSSLIHSLKRDKKGPKLYHFTFGFASLAVMIIIGLCFRNYLGSANIAMLLLIPTYASGILWGNRVGLFTAIIAALAFDFFFFPPFFTFNIADLKFLPVFFIFIIVSFFLSFLTRLVRTQSESLRSREQFVSSLYSFSRDILAVSGRKEIMLRAVKDIAISFHTWSVILLPDKDGKLVIKAISPSSEELTENEVAVSSWVYKNGLPAGRGTNTLSSSMWYFIPLEIQENILGVTGVKFSNTETSFNSEQKRLFESFSNIVALALSSTK